MFRLGRPTAAAIERFVADSQALSLSYEPVGLADGGRAGFDLDEEITVIGSGEVAFARAKSALGEWRHFELGWVDVFPKGAPIAVGTVVAVLIQHLGFWSLNGCRVVSHTGRPGDLAFGFAYGTLANHGEQGEEVFQVRFDPETGDVSYVVRAASRPRAALARLGYPVVRTLQARFRRDSTEAMRRAIAGD